MDIDLEQDEVHVRQKDARNFVDIEVRMASEDEREM